MVKNPSANAGDLYIVKFALSRQPLPSMVLLKCGEIFTCSHFLFLSVMREIYSWIVGNSLKFLFVKSNS